MKNKIRYIILGLVVCVFTFSVMTLNNNLNETTVTTSLTVLSNEKIGWGIKRNQEHKHPDVGTKNKELLEKYDGICLGKEEEKKIVLTFDEGYEAGYTNQILDILKNNEVTATFFLTAHYVNTSPDIVRRMIAEGHIIGNHIPVNSMYLNEKIIKLDKWPFGKEIKK